ncbi:hypothetical protein AVEN_225701-1 [Araneus ventricosus]|uniref:DUF4371 domain-containing protein n=1 Tax=Araneus ventricosus TaxID=182803 RepID=A0A4Y2FQP1_ARAVE|nr:hypothetical protein AVEN_225701-1 [Araneus ventricosus]
MNVMPCNIERRVADETVDMLFASQVDESTDISAKTHLLGFVRFIYEQQSMFKSIFILQRTFGAHNWSRLTQTDAITSHLNALKLSWDQCVGISIDDGEESVGSAKGFVCVNLEKKIKPNIIFQAGFSTAINIKTKKRMCKWN